MLKDADPSYFAGIYIVCGYTDLRYGIDSLASIIERRYKMKLSLMSSTKSKELLLLRPKNPRFRRLSFLNISAKNLQVSVKLILKSFLRVSSSILSQRKNWKRLSLKVTKSFRMRPISVFISSPRPSSLMSIMFIFMLLKRITTLLKEQVVLRIFLETASLLQPWLLPSSMASM